MRVVSRKELAKKLRKYLRLVGTGETVLVTRRGRVVAELAPLHGELVPAGVAGQSWVAAPVTLSPTSAAPGPAMLPRDTAVPRRPVLVGIPADLL